jgi:CRISPR-associated endonuclease/helicase Cas3
MIYEQQ